MGTWAYKKQPGERLRYRAMMRRLYRARLSLNRGRISPKEHDRRNDVTIRRYYEGRHP